MTDPAGLSPVELLTTTRTVRRRLDLDRPVPRPVVEECVRVALQAPNRNNRQPAEFVIVDDPDRRAAVAARYRRAYAERRSAATLPVDHRAARLAVSVDHLAERIERVPVLVVPCVRGTLVPDLVEQASMWSSILPAAWSFMLAARAHGLGTAWTTLHLRHAAEVAGELGIPSTHLQAGLIATAYTTGGGFGPGPRRDAGEVIHWNTW